MGGGAGAPSAPPLAAASLFIAQSAESKNLCSCVVRMAGSDITIGARTRMTKPEIERQRLGRKRLLAMPGGSLLHL